jgi:hypothetical protein
VAASYYGIPRTTLDADFVIHISPRQISSFLRDLGTVGIQLEMEKIRRQLKSGYNIITVTDRFSPHTADLILSPNVPEKRKGMIQGVKAHFQSPESLILAKLRMIKATRPRERSLKDRDDIKAIMIFSKVNRTKIVKEARRQTTLGIFRELAES